MKKNDNYDNDNKKDYNDDRFIKWRNFEQKFGAEKIDDS